MGCRMSAVLAGRPKSGRGSSTAFSWSAARTQMHSEALFGIPQLLVSLLFGASTPENVEAVHVLTQGWLTDMYAGRVYNPKTRTGIYGDPGDPGEVIVDIPTDAGLARGYVLPA